MVQDGEQLNPAPLDLLTVVVPEERLIEPGETHDGVTKYVYAQLEAATEPTVVLNPGHAQSAYKTGLLPDELIWQNRGRIERAALMPVSRLMDRISNATPEQIAGFSEELDNELRSIEYTVTNSAVILQSSKTNEDQDLVRRNKIYLQKQAEGIIAFHKLYQQELLPEPFAVQIQEYVKHAADIVNPPHSEEKSKQRTAPVMPEPQMRGRDITSLVIPDVRLVDPDQQGNGAETYVDKILMRLPIPAFTLNAGQTISAYESGLIQDEMIWKTRHTSNVAAIIPVSAISESLAAAEPEQIELLFKNIDREVLTNIAVLESSLELLSYRPGFAADLQPIIDTAKAKLKKQTEGMLAAFDLISGRTFAGALQEELDAIKKNILTAQSSVQDPV